MSVQEALSAPRFLSQNWPDSFAPHKYLPGTIELEASLYDAYAKDMEAMGYKVTKKEDWDNKFGSVCAIMIDPQTKTLHGGADPREVSWAMSSEQ